ncbi:MAG: bifunctional diaminohydroxyphosphoribosylaminopyrimidine deaminase/5-amino-6-(5-phosphoribosylamino)uracil reductase RibD [Candidatus Gracilibacteria bacterium]|jgi:diaminohydroxyphosphoribosylaminopyrimidine deaminase/5-amino-6-(5-phosphoribosylamino)uracil reductase|nr:bifunctional diaminohydroxyphosphoribosylaminopyrimidine deaminase/5-amino-6-(5-phosphoribosylamino)uracil reductase RibD [Candidatus Gracilibacteria bacterium]
MSPEKYMQMALTLAKKGLHHTSPNPMVGAIIVKDDKIIGQGYHKKYGGHHAEVEACLDAENQGFSLKSATMYVSLEPCCFEGKTPACTDLIIQKKISEIYIATLDPNPKVNSKGSEILKQNGIKTHIGILSNEAEKLNERFFYAERKQKAYIALKWAQSQDKKLGYIGQKTQITNQESIKKTHELRQIYDAILIGSKTCLIDDPQLNVRHFNGEKKDPIRIILDKDKKIPKTANVFKDQNYIHLTRDNFKINKNNQFNLEELQKFLYNKNIKSLLVEGGAKTIKSFIEQKIAQKAYIFTAPKTLGQNSINLDLKFDSELINQKNLNGDDLKEIKITY